MKLTKSLAQKIEQFGKMVQDSKEVIGEEHKEAADGHTLSASMKTKALLERFVEEKMKSSHQTAELEQLVLDSIKQQLGNMSPHQLGNLLSKLSEKSQNDLAIIFGVKLQRSGGNNAPHVPGGILGGMGEPHQPEQQGLPNSGAYAGGGAKMMKSLAGIFNSIVDEVRKQEMTEKAIDVTDVTPKKTKKRKKKKA